MPPRKFDRKTKRQLAIIKVSTLLAGAAFFVGLGGLYLWRLHHFPHAIATIGAIEEKTVQRRGTKIVTVAWLSFTRTSSAGASVECKHPFEIGTPSDDFKVGDKLEIVPDSGGCERVDIIGRAN